MDEIQDLKNLVQEMVSIIQDNQSPVLGDWIPQSVTLKCTGLSKSTLYRLRKSGVIRASYLSDTRAGLFYRASDLQNLSNERLFFKIYSMGSFWK